jgi:phosphoglycolate phosphatase/pyrophosphatase PpaX
MKLRYRCLIVDHDDTAVNSTALIHYPAHIEVLKVLRPGLKPISLEEWFLKNFHPGIMCYLKEELGFTEEEIRIEYRIWRDFTTNRIPEFYPGFIETLQEYHRRGGLVAVVSHSERDIIERDYLSCRGESSFFPDLIFGWDYNEERRKPSCFPVEEILKCFKLEPSEVLILDDLKPGVVMARASGIDPAAAGWGHSIPQIRNYMKSNCIAYFERVEDFRRFILP